MATKPQLSINFHARIDPETEERPNRSEGAATRERSIPRVRAIAA
jgi:hypothetical protein